MSTPAHVERVLRMPGVRACLTKGQAPNWLGRCPAHADEKESLSLLLHEDGRLGVTCFAGCEPGAVLAALGLTVADLDVPLTLETFARRKGLKVETLRKLGVEELPGGGLQFTYYDRDGKRLPRSRRRYSMGSKGVWDSEHRGEGTAGYLYGEQLAARSSDRRLVLVEGESDTAALVEAGVNVIGLPGATTTRSLSASTLENVDVVVAVREPDRGGETFIKAIRARLKALGFAGEFKAITPPDGIKDSCDWYQARPVTFRAEFDATVEATRPSRFKAAPKSAVAGAAFAQSDLGNAEYFAARYARMVRYDTTRSSWFVWDGQRWVRDPEASRVRAMMQDAIRDRQREAVDIADETLRTVEQRWAKCSEKSGLIGAALREAQVLRSIVIHNGPAVWDQSPALLGVPNGVVDLRTGSLRPGVPEDYITRQTAVRYDPTAKCPTWEKCISNIFEGKEELVAFFRRSLGYSITGEVGEQVWWLCYGVGGNGKTTALETPLDVLGDYAHALPFETIRRTRGDQHPTEIAAVEGKRFVCSLEFEGKAPLNEARIKALTGGDRQRARYMYADSFEFQPVLKLWVATNNRPVIKDTSRGFWRRILLVPFLVDFDRNPKIAPALKEERAGILRWLVEGAVEYYRDGLQAPPEVLAKTEELREQTDHLQEFLAATCRPEKRAFCERTALWKAYDLWAIDNVDEEKRYRKQQFFAEVRERFQETKIAGERGFRGLRMVAGNHFDDHLGPEKASSSGPDNLTTANGLEPNRGTWGTFLQKCPHGENIEEVLLQGAPTAPDAKSPQKWTLPPSQTLDTEDALDAWLATVPAGAVVALDTETTSLDATAAELVGVSLSVDGEQGVWLPVEQLGLATIGAALHRIDLTPGVTWALWHAAFDLAVLDRNLPDLVLTSPVVDAMIARQLVRAGRPGGDGLKATAAEILKVEPVEYEAAVAADILPAYAVQDAVYTRRLWAHFAGDVPRELLDVEQRVARTVARACARAWTVDEARADAELATARAAKDALEARIVARLGAVNLRSPKQLAAALVNAGVSLKARTLGGQLSTDDETLQELAGTAPIVADLLHYRRLDKALKTGQTLREAGSRVRFKIRPLATDTGRMAGGGSGRDGTVALNVQALPKRVPDGFPNLRAWLRPPEGCVVVACDLAQVEPRIAANLSGDPKLIGAFMSGLDPYQTIADELGIDRKTAKVVWLAVAYGAGAKGLARKTGIEEDRMRALVAGLHERFPALSAWKRRVEEQATACGYVENVFGRRRHLTDAAFVGTVAANSHIQSTAADVFKRAILEVEAALGSRGRLALFIHDEVVAFVERDAVDALAPVVRAAMTAYRRPDWPVRFDAEVSAGPTLGELEEI